MKWGQITISTRLLEQIARRTPEQQAALLAVAFEGEYWRPTCPSCGVKLMDRKPRSGGQRFWGCANYPRCKYTQPMAQTAAGRRHGER
ncbi:MAG: topoisomerase DNA-binding C4 zinc finger domain-containing protein [Ottowia sp.]